MPDMRKQMEEEAYQLGADRAIAEASWYLDGNSTEGDAQRFLKGIEDGDPEILDTLGRPPLAGEYADDYGIIELFRELGIEDDGIGRYDFIIERYEDGYWATIEDAVGTVARKFLGLPEEVR